MLAPTTEMRSNSPSHSQNTHKLVGATSGRPYICTAQAAMHSLRMTRSYIVWSEHCVAAMRYPELATAQPMLIPEMRKMLMPIVKITIAFFRKRVYNEYIDFTKTRRNE